MNQELTLAMQDAVGWNTDELAGGETHVYPRNDWREHVLSPACWCRPEQDDEEPGQWLHNSLDRREEFEEGRPMS